MGAKGGVEWEKKINDALPGSRRIDCDGLAVFSSHMLWLSLISIYLSACSCLFPWLVVLVIPIVSYKRNVWSFTSFQKKGDSCLWQFVFTQTPRQKLILNPNTKVLLKNKKINHGQKIKKPCAGAHSADMLYMSADIAGNPKQCVCGALKATVTAHHLAKVNGPTQPVDLLIFSTPWVTEWHTHINTC